MPDYAKMILELRHSGMSADDIVRWGRKKGHMFSAHSIRSILRRGSVPRETIRTVLEELHGRLCA